MTCTKNSCAYSKKMEHLLCDMILNPLDQMSHIQDFIKSCSCSVSGLYQTLSLHNSQQLRSSSDFTMIMQSYMPFEEYDTCVVWFKRGYIFVHAEMLKKCSIIFKFCMNNKFNHGLC